MMAFENRGFESRAEKARDVLFQHIPKGSQGISNSSARACHGGAKRIRNRRHSRMVVQPCFLTQSAAFARTWKPSDRSAGRIGLRLSIDVAAAARFALGRKRRSRRGPLLRDFRPAPKVAASRCNPIDWSSWHAKRSPLPHAVERTRLQVAALPDCSGARSSRQLIPQRQRCRASAGIGCERLPVSGKPATSGKPQFVGVTNLSGGAKLPRCQV